MVAEPPLKPEGVGAMNVMQRRHASDMRIGSLERERELRSDSTAAHEADTHHYNRGEPNGVPSARSSVS